MCIVQLQDFRGTVECEKPRWLKVDVIYGQGCTIDKPKKYGKFRVDIFVDWPRNQ